MIRAFIFLSVFSIAMVGAMVQFNSALVLDDPKRAEHRTLWGVLYVGLWIGVGYALWDVIRHERSLTTTDWAALILAPVGWLTFNAFWLAVWGAIEVQDARHRGAAPPARAVMFKRRGWKLTRAGLGTSLVLVVILGAPQAMLASIHPLANLRLSVVISFVVAGCVLLVWGGVRLALGIGQTKTKEESTLGANRSASGEVVVTFQELKQAWQQRLWLDNARWRTVFMMALGGILTAYGVFGIVIVIGPWPVSLICTGALVYATVQTIRGFLRS